MAKLISLQGATAVLPSYSGGGYTSYYDVVGTINNTYIFDTINIGVVTTSFVSNDNGFYIDNGKESPPQFYGYWMYNSFNGSSKLGSDITILFSSGSDLTNQYLIDFIVNNAKSIEGGIWEEETPPTKIKIINPQMYILPPTKVVGNDLIVSAEEVVVNEVEEEGLYFYIEDTKFVIPEEGITFKTLLKNYGTDVGSSIVYYGEGSTGIWSKCIYSDSSYVTLFYTESSGGSYFELNGTLITPDSIIVTGGKYTEQSSGSGGGSN